MLVSLLGGGIQRRFDLEANLRTELMLRALVNIGSLMSYAQKTPLSWCIGASGENEGTLEQGGGKMEVPRLEKELGSNHGALNFLFKAFTASLLLQEKYSELI